MGNLSLESTQTKNFNYLFLDRSGKLGYDSSDSLLGKIARVITSILRLRDYDLSRVFPVAQKELSERVVVTLTGKLMRHVGLTESQFENIQKISRHYLDPENRFSESEQEELKAFLSEIKGNLSFNNGVNQLISMKGTLDRVHISALKALRSFSFETTKVEKLSEGFMKIEAFQKGEIKEKLSLDEMYELESVVQLAPIFRELKAMGLVFDRKSELGQIRRSINITENGLSRLRKMISKETPPQLLNFIFYDFPNFSPRAAPKMRGITPLMFRVGLKSSIIHSSMSYRGKDREEVEVHMTKGVTKGRRMIYSHAFKTLVPDVEGVLDQIPTDRKQTLQKFYGDQWKHVLMQKFEKILIDYYNHPESFKSLSNPFSRRIMGVFGSKSLFNKDDLTEKMQLSSSQNTMCTEFVIKTLMQCYKKLEEEIKSDFEKAATRRSDVGTAPDLTSFLVIEPKAGTISPPGMARSLLDGGLVREVKRPQILGAVMDYHEYDLEEGLNLPRW